MQSLQNYREAFVSYLQEFTTTKEPKTLYEPINYILQLGGKRLRPILTLLTAELFNTNYQKAMNAALSVEVFHNFSLVHDDIMDDASLRRGKKTVHEKWDINTGILSGDAMLIMAYQLFEDYDNETFRSLARLFSATALKVCEGQQYDVDFEMSNDVSIQDYLQMIENKTAVLVGASMKMGAIVANASESSQDGIYEFGKNLGIAFQLQDDYLDAFGDPQNFGKKVGGDIIENKKTYLYLKAMEFSDIEVKRTLLNLYNSDLDNENGKIEIVTGIFKKSGAVEATKAAIKAYTQKAFSDLEGIDISQNKKDYLTQFGKQLMNREV